MESVKEFPDIKLEDGKHYHLLSFIVYKEELESKKFWTAAFDAVESLVKQYGKHKKLAEKLEVNKYIMLFESEYDDTTIYTRNHLAKYLENRRNG